VVEEEVFAEVQEEMVAAETEVVEEIDLDGQKMEEQMASLGWIQIQSDVDPGEDQAVAGGATGLEGPDPDLVYPGPGGCCCCWSCPCWRTSD